MKLTVQSNHVTQCVNIDEKRLSQHAAKRAAAKAKARGETIVTHDKTGESMVIYV